MTALLSSNENESQFTKVCNFRWLVLTYEVSKYTIIAATEAEYCRRVVVECGRQNVQTWAKLFGQPSLISN